MTSKKLRKKAEAWLATEARKRSVGVPSDNEAVELVAALLEKVRQKGGEDVPVHDGPEPDDVEPTA